LQPRKRGGKAVAMAMSRQARHDDVVAALMEFMGKANELLRACGNPMKKDDRDRPHLAMEQQLSAALVGNAAVVAEAEPFEQRARLVG
jgi:hypothetical protein